MNDSQFDDFFNDKLRGLAAPVPANLWEKISEGQFDQFIGNKLKNSEVPVPENIWGKISDAVNDAQFDDFVGDKLFNTKAPVSGGVWDKINDAQFDSFIGDKLAGAETAVPVGVWEKINDKQFDVFVGDKLTGTETAVPAGLWEKISDGQFDAFVGDKLKDHESPVPAGLWDKVNPEEEEDRPGFIWFRYPAVAAAVLGILIAAGAVGGYFIFSKKENNTTVHTVQGNNSSAANTTPVLPKENNNTTAAPSNLNAPASSSVDKSSPAVGVETNGLQEASPVASSSIHNDHTGSTPSFKTIALSPSSSASKNTQASSSGNRRKIDLSPVAANRQKDFTVNPDDPFIGRPNSVSSSTPANTNTGVSAVNETLAEIENYQQHSFLTGSTIGFGLNQLNMGMMDKQLSTKNHTNQFKSVIVCPTDRKNTDWFLEAYGSPMMALKSVGNVNATQQYLAKKDSAESMQIGFTAGLRIVKPINDNILLKAGLEYTQTNQKYVYRTENEIKTTTVVTVRNIIVAPGDTVVVKDTSVVQSIGFRTNTVKNHYRTIDVPLTVGYQFGDDDLKFGINAGVVFNLTSWYQGVILDTSLATVTLNKTGNMVYKSHLGIGMVGSVSVTKRLSDDLHIFFEPYFRYNFSNMTTPESSFKQKFSLGGLSIGLRLNLNRK